MHKKFLFNLLLIGILSIITAVFIELTVRLIPSEISHYNSTFYNVSDKELGYIHAPKQNSCYNKACFQNKSAKTDSNGFRNPGEERELSDYAITILGDSMTAAWQVSQKETFSAMIGNILNTSVLNLGTEGYGTLNELLAYKKHIKFGNLVILMFTENDIIDNQCELVLKSEMKGNKLLAPCAYLQDNEMRINMDFDTSYYYRPAYRIKIRRLFRSSILLKNLLKRAVNKKPKSTTQNDELLEYFNVYTQQESQEWKDAWVITEKVLIELKKEIEKNGGQFVLVLNATHMMTSKNWKKDMSHRITNLNLFDELDPLYPVERMKNIAERNNIKCYTMQDRFINYRDTFNVEYPYFSFWCDKHWNPIGHFIAANVIAEYLVRDGYFYLSDDGKNNLYKIIETNLNTPPIELLGKKSFDSIFNHGIYKGNSHLSEMNMSEGK